MVPLLTFVTLYYYIVLWQHIKSILNSLVLFLVAQMDSWSEENDSSQFAVEHGIRGENGVAKEFASVHGFDTTQLSARKYKTEAWSKK